jgi:Zn-dependent M32 family carboxypeptidase
MVGMDKEPSPRLKQAVAKYRRSEAAVTTSRDEMYDAILEDLAGGVRQVDIVQATGLTRERIRQIVKASQEAQ